MSSRSIWYIETHRGFPVMETRGKLFWVDGNVHHGYYNSLDSVRRAINEHLQPKTYADHVKFLLAAGWQ